MNEIPDFLQLASSRKAGVPGWKWFRSEHITGGFLFTGGVPTTYKGGKRKGQEKWDLKTATRVVVTDAEMLAEQMRWEEETGKCSRCYGRGEGLASAHADGTTTYRPCRDCGGSGKRKESAT